MVSICHLSTVHQRRDVRIVYKECFSLLSAGYKVHLVIADGKPDEIFQGLCIHGSHKYHNRFIRILFSPLSIFFKALSLRAELYHFHDMELLPVAAMLKILGFKVIYDVHDNLPKQILGKHYIAKPLRRMLSGIVALTEASLSPLMSAIITADKNKENRFKSYHTIVRSVHNYPILSELTLIRSDLRSPGYICYIGGITLIRGITQLLDAILPLDVTLILAGLFEPPGLEEICRKHPAWAKVDYRGFLDRKAIAEVLSISSIGMVNLLPNENYLDSLPIKLFEYMSSAMPVIISDFPDWRAIVDRYNCGICINPLEPKEITQAIETMLNNPELCKQMGERGKAAILEHLNWDSQEKVLLQLYKEVLSK
ncbi:glycosyltransferase family 4 protein [Candidatus Cloacimonadota bacterium]